MYIVNWVAVGLLYLHICALPLLVAPRDDMSPKFAPLGCDGMVIVNVPTAERFILDDVIVFDPKVPRTVVPLV